MHICIKTLTLIYKIMYTIDTKLISGRTYQFLPRIPWTKN